eukprot:scaffold1703_cov133-Chaetoceros_neogracile.AAC.1
MVVEEHTVAATELVEEQSITDIDENVTSLAGMPALHSPPPVNSKSKHTQVYESKLDEKWDTRFMELEKYKEKNGHCNCPQKNGSLGTWISKQRTLFTSKTLKEDRYEKLVGIGFIFESNNIKWDTRFIELEKYKEKNGHCNCPQKNGSLGKWISKQRNLFTSKTLKEDRYEKLVGIGFIFESNTVAATELVEEQSITDIDENVTSLAGMPALHSPPSVNSKSKHTQVYESKLDEKWDTRFIELEKYKEKNGHCNCPQKNGSLGKWIMRQRDLFTSKTLKEDRYEKLVEIGFIFESNNIKWDTRFIELEKYKEKNGHCNCPQKNGSLGKWISKQRTLFTSKTLKEDRYEKLVGI